jgi:hypothetical protein
MLNGNAASALLLRKLALALRLATADRTEVLVYEALSC